MADVPADAPAADPVAALAERLIAAARSGDAPTLVAYVDAGVPVDLAADTGDTLLMLAAYHGHAEAVRALLGRGADPELANARGQRPLAGAVFKGHLDVVRLLVEAGADAEAGQPSARGTASMFERSDILDILDSSDAL